MSAYSAAQVISPAIQRTRWYLFQPFRLGTFLKLALVAVLTEGGTASCNFPTGIPSSHGGGNNGGGNSTPFHWPPQGVHIPHLPALPVLVAIGLAVGLILTAVYLVIAYLLIRLRFSYFDCLLRGQRQIGPSWSLYHRQALRYLGLTLMIGLGFWIVLLPTGYLLFRHYLPFFQALASGGKPDFSVIVPLIVVVIFAALGLALFAYLLETTLSSFVMPRMALLDASIREALEDVWHDIKTEPGQFLLFYLLRALLSVAASFLGSIALILPFVIVAVIGAILVIALKVVSTVAAFAVGIPLAIVFGAAFLAGIIGVTGTIGTFRRNYALFFYAGRLPEMAAILWPPQPPLQTVLPVNQV